MFQPVNSGPGTFHSMVIPVVIANSTTIQVGEAVATSTSTGFLVHASAGARMLGIVVGLYNANDVSPSPTSYSPGVATSGNVQSITAASDNQTVAKQFALVEISRDRQYTVPVSGTIGTTVHSDQIGAAIDVDSADSNWGQLLESTATRTYTTVTNFYGYGTDPNNSSNLIVTVRCSERYL